MSERIKRPTVSGKTWQSLVKENEQLKAENERLIKDNDQLKKDVKSSIREHVATLSRERELQREIIEGNTPRFQNLKDRKTYAKQRGWDCFEEQGDE